LPLETRITDQIAVLRFSEVTEPILTSDSPRVETAVRFHTGKWACPPTDESASLPHYH
jgi:hypothetical protein